MLDETMSGGGPYIRLRRPAERAHLSVDMLRYCILVVVLAAAALAGGKAATKCPKVFGKYPFDETKFLGDWYYISGVDGRLEGARCAKVAFREKSEDISLTFKAIDAQNQSIAYEAVMQTYKADKSSMSMSVWRKEGTETWSSIFKASVVATDYETFGVIVACKPTFDPKTKTFGRALSAKILSRTTTLSKDIQTTLTNILSGFDIDITNFKMIDHSDC